MNRVSQKGIGIIGILCIAALVIFAAILVLKVIPVYSEYFAIKRAMNNLVASGDGGKIASDLRAEFDKQARIDSIKSLKSADLHIEKTASGTVVTARYGRQVPLVSNISLYFDFNVSTGRVY